MQRGSRELELQGKTVPVKVAGNMQTKPHIHAVRQLIRFIVLSLFALLSATEPLSGQKIGLSSPFEAYTPNVSVSYTYYDGRFDSSQPVTFDGEITDELRLKQQVVGARLSQQVWSRVQLHADAGIVENELAGSRFDSGPAYGGGIHVLLHPDPTFYLMAIGSFLWHDTVERRGDSDTEMQIRNDWQTGFLIGREGDAQPLLGEEITGSRTYVGVVYSARKFHLDSDASETFQHERYAGVIGLAGIQLDVGHRFGLAFEGHLGAAAGASGWLYYRF